MKKLFTTLALSLCAIPVLGIPWGLLSQAESIPEAMFPLHKYAKGQTITYCVDNYFHSQPSKTLPDVEKVFNEWPIAVSSFIKASGRSEEFKDILALTSTPIKLRPVECGRVPDTLLKDKDAPLFKNDKRTDISQEDIRIIYIPQNEFKKSCGSETALGCFTAGLKDGEGKTVSPAFILVQDGKDAEATLKHELGHAFGLSDQYLSSRANSSPKYGTSKIYPSIMDDAGQITCDDAEGFINAMDCLALKTSRGGKEGWPSICPQSDEVYINCSAKNRADFINISRTYDSVSISKYNEDGSLLSTTELPALSSNFKNILSLPRKSFYNVKRDKGGRISSLESKEGFESVFDYSKDGRVRIFSKGACDKEPIIDSYSYIKADTKVKGFAAFIATNYKSFASAEFNVYKSKEKELDITTVDFQISLKGSPKDAPLVYSVELESYNGRDAWLLRREMSGSREYSSILDLKDFYVVVTCTVSGKSKVADCYAGAASWQSQVVVPDEMTASDKSLMQSFVNEKERFRALDGSLEITIKDGRNIKKGKTIILSAFNFFKDYKDYGNNFIDNFLWAMSDTEEKEKKDKLIEELKGADQQNVAATIKP